MYMKVITMDLIIVQTSLQKILHMFVELIIYFPLYFHVCRHSYIHTRSTSPHARTLMVNMELTIVAENRVNFLLTD